MTDHSPFDTNRLRQLARDSARRSSALHEKFLHTRQASLYELKSMIAAQIAGSGISVVPTRDAFSPSRSLFTSQQLDEFGFGKISNCLGPAFSAYDTRPIPRIPNGDLKMMSRIVEISGVPRSFSHPASITAEYDVPSDAWYVQESAAPGIPYSLLMEIALQPCGFLSAYLDTYSLVPYGQFNFRNLDGFGQVHPCDVLGKTITTRARLLSSVVSAGTVIQRFVFDMTCAGRPVYQGESLFGYFSKETMDNQSGLDQGRQVLPWLRSPQASDFPSRRFDLSLPSAARQSSLTMPRLNSGRLRFLDEAVVVERGGQHNLGYVYSAQPVDPSAWYYPFHFYQDPVMPGSLGVEAALQAMRAYAIAAGLPSGFRVPRFGVPVGVSALAWRYRGQITPLHHTMELDVHLRAVERRSAEVVLIGDANVWVDGLRIYEIQNAAVNITEE